MSLTREAATLHDALSAFVEHAQIKIEPDPAMHRLIGAVSSYFCIPWEHIRGRGRSKTVAIARHVLTYLLRERFEFSYPELGHVMGRDHTTMMSSVTFTLKALTNPSHPISRAIKSIRMLEEPNGPRKCNTTQGTDCVRYGVQTGRCV